jgi:nucleoside-triphosphatase
MTETAPRLIVIDEIGKMECFSSLFRELVRECLDSPVPFLATIALRGTPPIEQIKGRPDVKLITMSHENRNEKLWEVMEEVRGLILDL